MSMKKVIGKLFKADTDFNLIQNGDRICVGVSGGKDSVLLLYALSLYQKAAKRIANKDFSVLGIHLEMGFGNMDFTDLKAFFQEKEIEYVDYPTQLYEILKLHPKNDKIQCSLCSKLKKGAIIRAAQEHGCNKVAFAHHADDAIETLFMNMIYGARISTFSPAMHLKVSNMDFIRPFIYCFENEIRKTVKHEKLPLVKSTCPNDGYTKRQETKELLKQIYHTFPTAKENFLTSLSNQKQFNLWVKAKDWRHHSK
ncbi:ATP-binding protein [Bulleidia sp. zg-1006]|uniref:tRNA 2-thiocytidine biosynthesis TtcA family protein n=1 Tax=Bulleidia sp. zg-1006 TaxID=2806552 RepID=UPI00193A4DF8|nr:ATP-binding protein [Bulleidia sp. zg-1006]QRG86253.1 tRNA 2-thiocytidine(32) synthetase TtcA [Bulleidia sp. zg-1006]